jgi:DNA polymerase III epsilon subunit-like protein
MEMEYLVGIAFLITIAYLTYRSKRLPPVSRSEYIDRSPPIPEAVHPRRDKAVNELKAWLSGVEMTDVVVFDTETNGLHPESCSVLSLGAIRFSWDSVETLKEKARFERFYFPKEPFNSQATSVNGLTEETIRYLRKEGTYPKYFVDDPAFKEFCSGVKLFVGHNIDFDIGFVPFIKIERKFDTMKSNINVVCAKWNDTYGEWKWPTLEETARFYSIPFSSVDAHGSLYDALVTSAILIKMLDRAEVKANFVTH